MSFTQRFLRRLRGDSISVGLDIGHTAVRGVMVLHKNKTQTLLNCAMVPLAEGVVTEGEPQNLDEIASAIQKILSEFKVSQDEVDIFLSLGVSPQILSDRVAAECFYNGDETQQIETHIEKTPPFDDKEIYYDYKLLGTNKSKPTSKDDKYHVDAIVVAAKNNHLDHWARYLTAMKIKARALDVDCFATYNAFSLQTDKIAETKVFAILNIGEFHSFITFVVDGIYHSTRILDRISVSQLSRSLITKVSLKPDQVRSVLFGTAQGYDAERISVLEQVSGSVNTSENFFKSSHKGIKLERIFVCGGGGSIKGLCEILNSRGNYTSVEPFYAFENLAMDSKIAEHITVEQSSIYAVALGLALRRA